MSWIIKELSEVCEIKLGKTPSRSDKSFWDVEKISNNKWASIADLSKAKGRNIFETKEYISDKGAKLFNPVEANTILMSFKLSIGKLAITTEKIYTNEAIVALPIKIKDKISQEFLYYFLQFYDWNKESENDIKVKGKTLNKEKLKKIKVPIPPLSTQQKIVAKLDAIFAEIDTASAAVEANAKNAEALFLQILNNLETEYSGNSKELGDCVELLFGFAFKSNEYTDSLNDIPLLRGDNLSPKSIDFSEAKRFDRSRYEEYEKFSLATNDIVLGMDRPIISTGLRIAKVESKDVPSLLVQRVMRLRCNKGVDSDFLFYLLNSTNFIKHLVGEQTGLGVPHISGKTISCYPIKIPSIETQSKIVSKLEAIVENLDSYKKANLNILNNWTCYRQSILKQAFNGELVKEC